MDYNIRRVRKEDLDRVTEVEALCFPPEEAAGREAFEQRISHFPESFFVAELSDGRIIGFINAAPQMGILFVTRCLRKRIFINRMALTKACLDLM